MEKQHQNEFKLETLENIPYRKEIESLREFPWNKKYPKKYFILPKHKSKTVEIRGRNRHIHIVEFPKRKIPMDCWLELLGWYLSEGCTRSGKTGSRWAGHVKKHAVCISQSKNVNKKYYDEIMDLLKNKLGYKVSRSYRKMLLH